MTYFRNARDKYDAGFRESGEKKPNPYYEEYLDKAGKDELFGYDFCTEQAENTLFNLAQYGEELSKIGFYVEKVDGDLLAEFWNSDTSYASYEPHKLEETTVETKLLMILMEHMHCELESERNMLVASMIDNMDDEEYKKNYKTVWGIEHSEGIQVKDGDTNDEIKPCPFCGEEVSVIKPTPRLYRPAKNHTYSVKCNSCDLWFGYDEDYGGEFDTEEGAIEAWNKRVGDSNDK